MRFPTPQREQLTRLATPATIDAVLRWNYQQLALPEGDHDLYYDPHTTHYTGTQNLLKGWCAAIRLADKLINADYIHTAQGHPIYFECTDNFDDLRGRFFPSHHTPSHQPPMEPRAHPHPHRGPQHLQQ